MGTIKKIGAAAAAAAKPNKSKKLYKLSGNSFLDIATGAKNASDYSVKQKKGGVVKSKKKK